MMAAIPTTTPIAFRDAILATCRSYFAGEVAQVGPLTLDDSENLGATLVTPAILLTLDSMTPVEDEPAWRHSLTCTCTLYGVLSLKTADLQGELAEFALALESMIRNAHAGELLPLSGNDWGLGQAVGPASQILLQPVDIGLNGRAAWGVKWSQLVYFSGILPPTV